jgi:hypothetical protein
MGRPLLPAETSFLAHYFGNALSFERMRIGLSIGQRCWSPYGNRMSLTRKCFESSDPQQAVNLDDPYIASTFAHEALHVWQRQHDVWVTLHGAVLQTGYVLRLSNPYAYQSTNDPSALYTQFKSGNIEQQGKIFEDYVYAHRTGADTSRFALIVANVRSEPRG